MLALDETKGIYNRHCARCQFVESLNSFDKLLIGIEIRAYEVSCKKVSQFLYARAVVISLVKFVFFKYYTDAIYRGAIVWNQPIKRHRVTYVEHTHIFDTLGLRLYHMCKRLYIGEYRPIGMVKVTF